VKLFDFGVEANGVFAVGQIATGVVAIGQLATGVIAIGQVARGVFAVGQLAIGLVAAGQLGVGLGYGAGMLGAGGIAGGLIPLGAWARWPFRDAMSFDVRAIQRSNWNVIGSAVLLLIVAAAVWFAALAPLERALFDVGGTLHQMS
jgi:hypothetical protein